MTLGSAVPVWRLAMLRRERDRFALLAEQTGGRWQRACADTDQWLLRATLLGHRRGLRLAADGTTATVTVTWRTTMGVRYPSAAAVALPEPASSAPSPGSTALVAAAEATRRAVDAAVQHAAATAAAHRIDTEIAVTRLRLHGIEDRRLPRLRAAAATIRLELDEQERVEAARLRWAAGTIALPRANSGSAPDDPQRTPPERAAGH